MSLVYAFLKIYPAFAIGMIYIMVELAVGLRRKGSKLWVSAVFVGALFFVGLCVWLWFRGDKNADLWYQSLRYWLRGA